MPPLLEYILRMCLHHDPKERLNLESLWSLWLSYEANEPR